MRPDGERVKDARIIEQFAPYLLKTKHEALIFYKQTIPVQRVFEFIKRHNEQVSKKEYTFFSVLLSAMVKIAPEFPQLGRFVVGKRLYRRNEITFSFVMKSSNDREARNNWVKVHFTGKERLNEIATLLNHLKEETHQADQDSGGGADDSLRFLFRFPPFLRPLVFSCAHLLNRLNLLPKKMIEGDPMFAACVIANVGSVGLNPPYHHLYEWGTCSLFMSIGKAYPLAVPHEEKGYVFKQVMDIHYTLDERTAFGTFSTKALDRLEYYLNYPELLE